MKNLMRSTNKQKGLSSLGWIVVIDFFALLTISILKVFPMYYDNYKVKTVLELLRQDTDVDAESKRAIWVSLSKRLYAEAIVSVQREHVSMARKDGKTNVSIFYETRNSYIANLFIGAKFKESVVIER
jgi:hypothetical protein